MSRGETPNLCWEMVALAAAMVWVGWSVDWSVDWLVGCERGEVRLGDAWSLILAERERVPVAGDATIDSYHRQASAPRTRPW
jgi:hypothetical protein